MGSCIFPQKGKILMRKRIYGIIEVANDDDKLSALYDMFMMIVIYGDIYPVTVFGKLVSMISSVVGIAVVALPAGVITGGYIDVIKSEKSNDDVCREREI